MDHLLKMQRGLYQDLIKKLRRYTPTHRGAMARYEKSLKSLCKLPFKISSHDQLLLAIEKSPLILMGDFHTHDQSLRNFLRILRKISTNHFLTIGLEMVQSKFQNQVNSFLEGDLTELEFLESIQYAESWRFPWGHYREIFSLAKQYKIQILALNSRGTLENRDGHACELIKDHHLRFPQRKLLILFGELHLCSRGIPFLLKKINFNPLVIHQNLEDLFWRLPPKIQKNGGAIKFGSQEYALVSSPPWVKLDSVLNWYEGIAEDSEFDLHQIIYERGIALLGPSHHDQFKFLSTKTYDLLKNAKTPFIDFDDFELIDNKHSKRLLNKLSYYPHPYKELYLYLFKCQQTFSLPFEQLYFFPSYSFNRLSILVGEFLFNHSRTPLQIIDFTLKSKSNLFIYLMSQSFFSYLVAKTLNPNRKCSHLHELKIGDNQNPQGHILKALVSEPQKIDSILRIQSPINIFQCSFYLGRILGDLTFDHYSQNPTYFKSFIHQLWYGDLYTICWKEILAVFPEKTFFFQKTKSSF